MGRRSEIMKGFEEAYKQAIADTEPEDVVMAREVRLRAVLEGYVDWRDKQLAEIAESLSSVNESMKEMDGDSNWKSQVREAGSVGFKMIADLDDNEESILNVFVLGVATLEGDFWSKIASMPYGAVYGFLGESAAILREEHEKLGDKWAATEDGMESVNEKSERAGRQMREAFDNALDQAASANRRAAEAMKTAFLAWKKYNDAKSGGEPGLPAVGEEMIGPLDLLVDSIESVAEKYENLYRTKETRLVLYGNHREAVREFLDKTNLELAQKRVAEARSSAMSIAGSMLTTGQCDDAKAFAASAGEALSKQMENYESAFNELVKQFQGIFIGPIGTTVLDALLHGKFWQDTEAGIQGLNLETALKTYYDEADDMWSIPVDGLDDELKDAFTEQFRKQLAKYDKAVGSAANAYARALALMAKLSIDLLIDKVSRFKGWLE
jgi:hypothetical protein